MDSIENMTIDEIEKELKKSPLFNLSLANKELFHSNFLAWFGRMHQDLFVELINTVLKNEYHDWNKDLTNFEIRREHNHFDICVLDKDEKVRLVVENKIKSVPTKKQLFEYEDKIIKHNKSIPNETAFVLLTMNKELQDKDDPNIKLRFKWECVQYKELSKVLGGMVDRINSDYHKLLVVDYCKYISMLQRIIDNLANNDSKCYNDKETLERLKKLGIHDICGKRKIQSVYNVLIQKFNNDDYFELVSNAADLESGSKQIRVGWGYTNGPNVGVQFKVNDNGEYVHIQIQGNQYRHAVEFFDDKIGDRICRNEKGEFFPSKNGIDYLRENYPGVLFNNNPLKNYPEFNPTEFGQNKKDGKKENGYCKYCNGRINSDGKISCFVYQWVEIPQIPIDDLTDLIVKDVKKIMEIVHCKITISR